MPERGARLVAIVVPTADPTREPAKTAIARARATTAHLGATIHIVTSSGPEFRFSRSVNRGMNEAPDADAWVLLNDDCFMDDGWLEAMLDTARSHPEVGIVGAVLRYPSGRIQHAGGFLMRPLPYALHQAARNRAPFFGLRRAWASRRHGAASLVGHFHRLGRQRLDLATGACMLITRACRDRIGGYDEEFEFSYEDVDYCLRALAAGMEVALAIDARGVHLERATGGGLRAAELRSRDVFAHKWPRRRADAVVQGRGRRGIRHGAGRFANCACALGER